VNKNFLRDILNGKKRLLKKNQVNFIHVPYFDELSVKNLWEDVKDDEEIQYYFQDKFPNEKGPNRKYFFDILNTIHPIYLRNIMEHSSKQRYTTTGDA